jgi:hypothetical protein
VTRVTLGKLEGTAPRVDFARDQLIAWLNRTGKGLLAH